MMKKIYIFCLLFFIIINSYSQTVIEWQNTIGGGGNDRLFSMQQTFDGGYILGGFSNSNISGDKTENSNGSYDYWVVKTDILGNIQWQNNIGGSGLDNLFSIQQTFDGGYILGGFSNSNISGDKTENSSGSFDYWIIKLDITGNIQWQNTIGGRGDDKLYSLQQTSDGGYILGGNSTSGLSGNKARELFAHISQERVASAEVGLRLERPAIFELLAHPPNCRHAKTEPVGNLPGAFALVIKLQNALTHRHRDRSHGPHPASRPHSSKATCFMEML